MEGQREGDRLFLEKEDWDFGEDDDVRGLIFKEFFFSLNLTK
jgi:hypothetical protein